MKKRTKKLLSTADITMRETGLRAGRYRRRDKSLLVLFFRKEHFLPGFLEPQESISTRVGISAIEVAIMTRNAIDLGDKKSGSGDVWSKIKYDRQIAAIAKVRQATAIYTDDIGLRNIAAQLDMPAIGIAEPVLPPEVEQGVLPLDAPAELPNEPTLEEISKASGVEIEKPEPT